MPPAPLDCARFGARLSRTAAPRRPLPLRRCSSAARPSAPPPPPPRAATKLTPSRRLVLVHGVDAPKYLQGVTTTNIPALADRRGSYSAFLTAQGRVLFDVFVYPTNHSAAWRSTVANPDDPAFILECDAASVSRLIAHVKRYKLRSKFSVRALEPGEWDAWSVWNDVAAGPPTLDPDTIGCLDQRAPDFGQRLILPNGSRPPLQQAEGETEVDAECYRLRRILHGIAEGQDEIIEGSALPQESNMDFMGGIDFRKGCYVGQELTIRTHHTGVVRKRILPVQMYPLDADGPPGSLVYDPSSELELPPPLMNIARVGRKGRSAGKFLGGVGNVGLALCRLEIMTDIKLTPGAETGFSPADEFRVDWERGEGGESTGVKIKAFVPSWHLLGNPTASSTAPRTNSPYSEQL